jgi:hypothetical protein
MRLPRRRGIRRRVDGQEAPLHCLSERPPKDAMDPPNRRGRQPRSVGAATLSELGVEGVNVSGAELPHWCDPETRKEDAVDDASIRANDSWRPVRLPMIEPALEELTDRALANRSMRAIADLGYKPGEGGLGFALRSLNGAMRVPLAPSQGVAAGMDTEFPGPRSPLPYRTGHTPHRATDGQADGQIAPAEDRQLLAAPLTSYFAAPPAGFEPATHGLGNRRSIP